MKNAVTRPLFTAVALALGAIVAGEPARATLIAGEEETAVLMAPRDPHRNDGMTPVRIAAMPPAAAKQVAHVLAAMCREMEAMGVAWSAAEPLDCVAAQERHLWRRCEPNGRLIGDPRRGCASEVAREAREWLRVMHIDIFGTRRPIPVFSAVAPPSRTPRPATPPGTPVRGN